MVIYGTKIENFDLRIEFICITVLERLANNILLGNFL